MNRLMRWGWAFLLVGGLLCGCGHNAGPNGNGEGPKSAGPAAKTGETVVVRSVRPQEVAVDKATGVAYGLTWKDYERLRALDVPLLVPVRHLPWEAKRKGKVCKARLVATTESFARANGLSVAEGRFLVDGTDQPIEGVEKQPEKVVVLGARVAAELYGSAREALGHKIPLADGFFPKVVGVLKERPARKGGAGDVEDYNLDMYIHLGRPAAQSPEMNTLLTRLGPDGRPEPVDLDEVLIPLGDAARAQRVADKISESLTRHHKVKDWDVTLR
jgi:hypothetical protein